MDVNEYKKLSAQEYLGKHQVHTILEDLAAELVLFKPNNPVEYMIERVANMRDGVPVTRKNAFFVLGPPGSGKGTICAKIVDSFGFTSLTIADILSAEVRSGSEQGKTIELIRQEGKIVPKEILIPLLKREMERFPDSNNFLLDGFPRAMDLAVAFEQTFFECRMVLYLACPEEVCKARLAARHKLLKTPLDTEEVVAKRCVVFKEVGFCVVQYFDALGKVRKVDASAPLEEVWESVKINLQPKPL
mmetsp:Transcript_132516/g.229907  ORF Transcript_132516/g.229907 Transcript_132516/m.229907 type:complete len:246 (-) Transcript_132516:144-881(-)